MQKLFKTRLKINPKTNYNKNRTLSLAASFSQNPARRHPEVLDGALVSPTANSAPLPRTADNNLCVTKGSESSVHRRYKL